MNLWEIFKKSLVWAKVGCSCGKSARSHSDQVCELSGVPGNHQGGAKQCYPGYWRTQIWCPSTPVGWIERGLKGAVVPSSISIPIIPKPASSPRPEASQFSSSLCVGCFLRCCHCIGAQSEWVYEQVSLCSGSLGGHVGLQYLSISPGSNSCCFSQTNVVGTTLPSTDAWELEAWDHLLLREDLCSQCP